MRQLTRALWRALTDRWWCLLVYSFIRLLALIGYTPVYIAHVGIAQQWSMTRNARGLFPAVGQSCYAKGDSVYTLGPECNSHITSWILILSSIPANFLYSRRNGSFTCCCQRSSRGPPARRGPENAQEEMGQLYLGYIRQVPGGASVDF